jgi:hypothetical protein
MLRDNLVGLIEPMLSGAGAYPLALRTNRKQSSDDRPACLENPRPAGAESTLTENVASPFHAEPGHFPILGPGSNRVRSRLLPTSGPAVRGGIASRFKVVIGRCEAFQVFRSEGLKRLASTGHPRPLADLFQLRLGPVTARPQGTGGNETISDGTRGIRRSQYAGA